MKDSTLLVICFKTNENIFIYSVVITVRGQEVSEKITERLLFNVPLLILQTIDL